MRPRVVKRGVGDFESIDEGTYETNNISHVHKVIL